MTNTGFLCTSIHRIFSNVQISTDQLFVYTGSRFINVRGSGRTLGPRSNLGILRYVK